MSSCNSLHLSPQPIGIRLFAHLCSSIHPLGQRATLILREHRLEQVETKNKSDEGRKRNHSN